MVELVLTPPQALGKPFTNWSLAKLKEHLARDRKGSKYVILDNFGSHRALRRWEGE